MPSQIDPKNIVDAFPLQGKNNTSQVFRDNFNIIKFNLRTAALEISELQNRETPVNPDWSAQTGLAAILNKPEIPPPANIIAGENVVVDATGIPGEFIISSTGGGGEPYDQQLNTFNDVEFNSVLSKEYISPIDQDIEFKVKTSDDPAWRLSIDTLDSDGEPASDCYISSTVVDILGNTYSMGAQGNDGYPFVVKVNANGDILWIKELQMAPGYRGYSSGDSIAIDSQGNIICGFMLDNALEIGFLVKLTSNGDVLWSRSIDYQDLTQPEDSSTPTGTLWNTDGWTSLTNLNSRSYVPFVFAMWANIGNNILNKELVMKFTTSTNENRFYKIKFTAWAQGNSGGGAFTYERQRVDPVTGLAIGSTVTFTKPALADPFTVFDEVVPGELRISRGNNEFIFNTVVDSAAAWDNPRALRRDPITSISTDSNNNIYALSYITSWPVTGNEGIVLTKFSATGTIQWSKDIEVSVNIPYHVTDTNGDSYIAVGWGDIYFYKINTNGQVVWNKTLGNDSGIFSRTSYITIDNNFIYSSSRTDNDGLIIVKLDKATGNLVWSKSISTGSIYCNGLETDNENLYIFAGISGNLNFYSTVNKTTGEVVRTFEIPNIDTWWYWTGRNLVLNSSLVYLSGYTSSGSQYAELLRIPKDPTALGIFPTLNFSSSDFAYVLSEDSIPPVTDSNILIKTENAYAGIFIEIPSLLKYTSDEWVIKFNTTGNLELPGYSISGISGNQGDLLSYEDGIARWKANPLAFDNSRNFIFNSSTPISSRIDNIAIGYLSQSSNVLNGSSYFYGSAVSLGNYTLVNNVAGSNVAIGYGALRANTTGGGNTGIGYNALTSNTIGAFNVGIGIQTGETSNGNFNLYAGAYSGNKALNGSNNVSLGYFSSFENQDGSFNTVVGSQAARLSTSLNNITAIGAGSLEFLTTGIFNTSLGSFSLQRTTTGSNNTATGFYALLNNTTGNDNTAVGAFSLQSNTTGNRLTGVGEQTLQLNTNGYDNTAVGSEALRANTTGYRNTAVGVDALDGNTTGFQNTAIGTVSMMFNTTGSRNTAVGDASLYGNTSGTRNTAVGQNSLLSNTTGYENTGLGDEALRANTTGYRNTAVGTDSQDRTTTGYEDTSVGVASLHQNTTGYRVTAIGAYSLYNNSSGYQNTAVGTYSLNNNNTGFNNTAVGEYSALGNTTGSSNTFVGRNAGSNLTTGSNNSFLGVDSQPVSSSTSNSITLGNSSITSLRCQVTSITSLSDARDKTDIESLDYGLDFLNKLKPVKFTWNMRDGGKVGVKSSGFIAQDLQKLQDETGAKDYLNLVLDENPEKLEATYGNLIPVLVKAIQELTAEVNELKKRIKE